MRPRRAKDWVKVTIPRRYFGTGKFTEGEVVEGMVTSFGTGTVSVTVFDRGSLIVYLDSCELIEKKKPPRFGVDRVKCPHCDGKGHTELGGVYAETLQRMREHCSQGGYVVANRDAELFGCNPTALNNRLKRLEELGFVVSEKSGRQRRFVPVAFG